MDELITDQLLKMSKVHPIIGHEEPEVQFYTALTLVLDGGGEVIPCPGHYTMGKKTWYPLYRRLIGPWDQPGHVQKILLPPGLKPGTKPPMLSQLPTDQLLLLLQQINRYKCQGENLKTLSHSSAQCNFQKLLLFYILGLWES